MNMAQFVFILLSVCHIVAGVDPCEDFYAFACEEFTKNVHIPEDEIFQDQLTLLDAEVNNKMKDLLKQESQEDMHSTKVAKTFYNSCLHQDNNIDELYSILEEIHGWPVVSGWNESSYDWIQVLYRLRELGLPADFVFQIVLEPGYKDGEMVYEIMVSQPPMRWYISNNTIENQETAAYYKYMTDVAQLLGADRQTAEADMMNVLLFEYEVEMIKQHNLYYGRGEPISNIQDLSNVEPRVPWLEYINNMILGAEEVDEYQQMFTYDTDYINKIMGLILRTNNRTLANFISWKVVDFSLDYLTENLKKLKQDFQTQISEVEAYDTREDECLQYTIDKFPDVATAMYLERYFTEADEEVVEQIIELIRNEFRQMIWETEWMDEETKYEANRKLEHLNVQIGYLDGVLEEDQMENKYEQLELTSSSFLRTSMNVSGFLQSIGFSRLNQPWGIADEEYELFQRATSTKAAFHTSLHRIDLPAGLLQPPIFNKTSSNAINYGSIGYVIGHEFNHGFNLEASYFNYFGYYDPWWTEATKEAFQNKSQCVIDTYEDIIKDYLDEEVNGDRSLEENLADFAGAKLAYRVYQRIKKENQEEQHESADYSSNQSFWMSLANFHCAKYDIPRLKANRSLRYDTHLPRKARMNGIAMNNQDFARDWSCESGSPMNPQEKCQVW